MNQLGSKYLAVTGAGTAAAGAAALAAFLKWWPLAVAGLALALVCVLAALALIRTDIARMRATLGRVPAASGAVTARHSAAAEVHLARRVATEVRDALPPSASPADTRPAVGDTEQVAALLWLHAHRAAATAPPLALPGAMPAQFAALLHQVEAPRPARALVIGTSAAATAAAWLASATGSSTTLATDDVAGAQGPGVDVVTVPHRVPAVPHAWLEWHDLSSITGPFDLVVVVVGSGATAATRPVLPLLERLVGPDGVLVALEADPGRPVAASWVATPGWDVVVDGAVKSLRRTP